MTVNRIMTIPLLGAPGIQLTNTTLKENLTDSAIQFSSISALMRRFEPDGIFFMMDLTVEAQALGLEIGFPDNENPYVKEHSLKTPDDLVAIKENWKGLSGRMEVFVEVARMIARNLSGLKGGYVIGPFSLAGELVGVTDMCMLLLDEPQFSQEIIQFCSDVVTEYAEVLFDQGLDVIAVLEPTAVLLSKKQFSDFALPYFSSILSRLDKPLIYHICGNTQHLIPGMGNSGAYGLSLDSMVDLKEVAEVIPKDVKIIGNLDPVKIFLQSSPQQVSEATHQLLNRMKGIPNFVLSSGCDIPHNVPLENIDTFMEVARTNT